MRLYWRTRRRLFIITSWRSNAESARNRCEQLESEQVRSNLREYGGRVPRAYMSDLHPPQLVIYLADLHSLEIVKG